MKLLTLNIWGGTVYGPLIKFIKQQGKSVDILDKGLVNLVKKYKV